MDCVLLLFSSQKSSPLLSTQVLETLFKHVFCWKHVSSVSDVDGVRIIILGFYLFNKYLLSFGTVCWSLRTIYVSIFCGLNSGDQAITALLQLAASAQCHGWQVQEEGCANVWLCYFSLYETKHDFNCIKIILHRKKLLFYSQDGALKVKPGNHGQAAWINSQATKPELESRVYLKATEQGPNHSSTDPWSYNQELLVWFF